jgi:hypothetical protein
MVEILVPLGLFAIIPLTVWAVSAYRFKSHSQTMGVLDTMAQRGDTLTPEIIAELGVRRRPKHADLRLGLVLIALGLATFITGMLIPEDEAMLVFTAFSSFPLLVGLVYVGLWFGISRKDG